MTASGVHAFSSTELLTKAGLTDEQVIAIQEAQELKASGDIKGARATLQAAGVTKDTMRHIREVAKEAKRAVQEAVEAHDYDAFVAAVADSPLADIITTEEAFDQFVEAHELRAAGDRAGAKDILEDLGIDVHKHTHKKHGKKALRAQAKELLTDEQKEALEVAHRANDRETVRAIFAEVGIDLPVKKDGRRR
jgi:hypothetical protein